MCAGPSRRIARPTWGRLYALVLAPLAGLTALHLAVPAGRLLDAAECGIVLAAFGSMAVWVRLNRAALEQQQSCDCSWQSVTVRVIPSRRPAPGLIPSPRHPDRVTEPDEPAWAPVSAGR